jgi:hypothetical protein
VNPDFSFAERLGGPHSFRAPLKNATRQSKNGADPGRDAARKAKQRVSS